MPLIGADEFLWIVRAYRVVWIKGRVGGFKTSIAMRIGAELLKGGKYRLVTNTACVWADDYHELHLGDDKMLHELVILDEGGSDFQSRRDVENVVKYPRKMDVLLLIPSFWPPHRSARLVTLRVVRSWRAFGIPILVYEWEVREADAKGKFVWLNPAEIFGVYSTQDPADTAEEIVAHLVEQTKAYLARFGRKERRSVSLSISAQELFGGSEQSSAGGAGASGDNASADQETAILGQMETRQNGQSASGADQLSTLDEIRRSLVDFSDVADEIDEAGERFKAVGERAAKQLRRRRR